jgi:hypothetical protein
MMHRRAILRTAVLGLPMLVAGCPQPTLSAATIIADAQSAFAALKAQLPAILQAVGTKLTTGQKNSITQAVNDGSAVLAGLNATTPAPQAATALQQVDSYLNTILSIAGTLVPPPYGILIEALALLAPEIESFINAALGKPNVAAATAPYPHPDVPDIDTARSIFKRYGG